MNPNPYAPPASGDLASGNPASTATPAMEALRKTLIGHEASIKSIALLYILGGIFCLFLAASYLLAPSDEPPSFLTPPVLTVMALVQIWTAIEIRRLSRRSKIGVGIVSGIGLLGFPVGTLVNLYILYLVFSRKGSMVLSETYRATIDATPHIKQPTSLLVWASLRTFVLIFAALLAYSLIRGMAA